MCVFNVRRSFSSTKSKAEYRKCNIPLWQVPPRSLDLNLVEQYWSRLRRRSQALDLAVLTANRPVPSEAAYIQRVRKVVRSQVSQEKAASIAKVRQEEMRAVREE